ncbi:cytochrome P450 [Streptomyces griseocarneus]|uniref:cytochrome P450 n=1 Tax=Streptomyces griseocarneus TaxID=51201 RepID=UPI00167CD207|nr:cytochrome P450 [Streptomyces griseocarneus]MBZ6477616.1 cytochrome P450 [Streptomyces griseocarneus]GHG83283.1 cytochrome P450 [Streptomyces griseocarneus]
MTAPNTPACPFHAAEFSTERLDMDPKYDELRRTEPLARVTMPYGGDAWMVTRHEDARTVLADPRFSRAAAAGRDIPRSTPLPDQQNASLLSLDPPEHSRLRRLVTKAFTHRRVSAMRPRVQEIVDGMVDRMTGAGSPADVVSAVAWPLPLTVICEILGIPAEDHGLFRDWIDRSVALSADDPQTIKEADEALFAYISGLVAQRRARPTDDLMGQLVVARDEGDKLTELELVVFGVNLLIAGQETTANELGNFLYVLLSRPERWQALAADPALIPTAVEELLRYTPLEASVGGLGFPRVALEDVELGGRTVRAGDTVVVPNASANRDASVFDRPDDLVLSRQRNQHLTFGHGAHHCLGAQLARLELQVALGTLVRRLPSLRLAVPADEVTWKANRMMRGVEALPVTW